MVDDLDRIEFYNQLGNCKSKREIEDLINNIDNENLLEVISEKYKQVIEFNKIEDEERLVKDIIRILEITYINFSRRKEREN